MCWDDIDIGNKQLRVRHTLSRVGGQTTISSPKTSKSRRTLPLSDGLVALLEEQRVGQDAERRIAGSQWRGQGLVFTTELGLPMVSRNVLRTILRSAKRVGITRPVGVHSLRHSAATAMIEAGVNLKAVADLLGHADIRMTANTYGHVTDDAARRAMDSLTSAMGLTTAPNPVGVSVGVRPVPEQEKAPSDDPDGAFREGNLGGAEGIRTPDPLHAMQVRYQLRHSPVALFSAGVQSIASPRQCSTPRSASTVVRQGRLGKRARVVLLEAPSGAVGGRILEQYRP